MGLNNAAPNEREVRQVVDQRPHCVPCIYGAESSALPLLAIARFACGASQVVRLSLMSNGPSANVFLGVFSRLLTANADCVASFGAHE